ncbi:MAG: glycine-rich domain-containing protein [Candidatus Altiarchaeia archaeon]
MKKKDSFGLGKEYTCKHAALGMFVVLGLLAVSGYAGLSRSSGLILDARHENVLWFTNTENCVERSVASGVSLSAVWSGELTFLGIERKVITPYDEQQEVLTPKKCENKTENGSDDLSCFDVTYVNETKYRTDWLPFDSDAKAVDLSGIASELEEKTRDVLSTAESSEKTKEEETIRFCFRTSDKVGQAHISYIALTDSEYASDESTDVAILPLNASGGTITTYTNVTGTYIIHTFTSNGTFIVPIGGTIEILIVAGGGGGAKCNAGGGGAGGLIYNPSLWVLNGSYSVIVGIGGTQGMDTAPGNGGNSSFNQTLIAIGGGAGGINNGIGSNGGSGGGGGSSGSQPGGNGTIIQGNNGGNGSDIPNQGPGGGGGGAGAVGNNGVNLNAGNGGTGLNYSISGSSVYYAGGGGGGCQGSCVGGTGGLGGGGAGGGGWNHVGTAGSANTGGGGGAGSGCVNGGVGGSGIVIIRYLLDTTTPVVSLLAPANNSAWTASSGVNFTYNVSQTYSGISYCNLTVNTNVVNSSTSITKDTNQTLYANLTNGVYNWSVNCTGQNGLMNWSTTYNVSVVTTTTTPTTTTTTMASFCSLGLDCGSCTGWAYINATSGTLQALDADENGKYDRVCCGGIVSNYTVL